MTIKVPTINDIKDKKVLIRCDFNAPLKPKGGKKKPEVEVADDTKIKSSLETIGFCLKHASQVILCSHLGRPKGKADEKLSLRPIAKHLGEILKMEVLLETPDSIASLQNDNEKIILLENLRFNPGEKKNDPEFSKQLASLADVYINEAFASSHRKHASVYGVTKHLPSFGGFGLKKEVEHLEKLLENPKRPFVVVVGGAKISDKLTAIENLSKIADTVLVGGGIANNFLKAEHFDVYKSYMEDAPADLKKEGIDFVKFADQLLDQNRQENSLVDGIPIPKILYPIDVMTAENPESKSSKRLDLISRTEKPRIEGGPPARTPGALEEVQSGAFQETMFLDIGPKTIELYKKVIAQAKTVFWNGPMGVFENPEFEAGTKKLAKAISESSAYTVIGGGETLKAADHFGLKSRFSYASAAGGAALEFLAGNGLPGLEAIIK